MKTELSEHELSLSEEFAGEGGEESFLNVLARSAKVTVVWSGAGN